MKMVQSPCMDGGDEGRPSGPKADQAHLYLGKHAVQP